MRTIFGIPYPTPMLHRRHLRQRRAYFKTRELARIFFLKVRDARPWPQHAAWTEMPVSKGFLVTWYD